MKHDLLSCQRRTRSVVRAFGLSVVLLLNHNLNVRAQDLPPLPGGGTNQPPPYNPTPEELEAQRVAQEALWQKNRETIAPFLHVAPAPEPLDEVLRQRLIAAELLQRERDKAAQEQRKVDILNWSEQVGERQLATRVEADRRARALGYKLRSESKDGSGVSVDMVGDRLVFATSYNVVAAKTISTEKARTNAPDGYDLSGAGIMLGLWDGGIVGTNHVEFTNGGYARVFWLDTNTMVDPSGHPTSMAGTMAAAGVDAAAKGMAPEVTLLAYNRDNDYSKMASSSVQYGLKISNHSYGFNMGWGFEPIWWGNSNAVDDVLFSAYTQESHDMDLLAYSNPNYLAVWASGNGRSNADLSGQNHLHWDEPGLHTDSHNANYTNYGGFGTLNFLATAKNGLTVGAVADLTNGWQGATSVVMTSFSFWGPTDDGRVKPDVVADGTTVYSTTFTTNGSLTYATGSGTSAATASVTGSLGLIAQRFEQFGMNTPTAATLRGLVTHTADDAGAAGPDYKFGFGLMNTDRAAALVMENALSYNPMSGSLLADGHLLQGVLTNGTTLEFQIVQPTNSPVKLTVTWTDPPGNYGSVAGQLNPTNSMLVNDLDVVIISPGVSTNQPYVLNAGAPYAPVTTGDNWRDNIEQVVVPAQFSTDTFLTVRITHKGTLKDSFYLGNTTNQAFSVWVSGNLVYSKAAISLLTQTGSNTVAVAWYANVGSDYKVQYIDEVDAPSSAWTDATGTITAQSPLVAAEVYYSPSQPRRFFRIKTL